MEHQQILDIINAVSASNLTSFEFEQGDVYLNMTVQQAAAQQVPVQPGYALRSSEKEEIKAIQSFASNGGKDNNALSGDAEEGRVVKSPLVGTFYSASSPDAEKFVKVGDRVTKGQTLGIIEAMKLMNEIESEYDGTVSKILVENKEVVEYGQPLFVIKED